MTGPAPDAIRRAGHRFGPVGGETLEAVPDGVPGAETALWRAVVARPVEDCALEPDGYAAGSRAEARRARNAARSWALAPGGDFAWVCHLGGLDASAVRAAIRARLDGALPAPPRARIARHPGNRPRSAAHG
jgi:hypothetical protein